MRFINFFEKILFELILIATTLLSRKLGLTVIASTEREDDKNLDIAIKTCEKQVF